MNGPLPENANAPTEGPRRSSDDGLRHRSTTEPAQQYRMYAPGAESLRDVLIRVLGRIAGNEVSR